MPAIQDTDIGKIVWVKCRAKSKCPGNQSKILMKFRLPAGGTSIRYRCQTCKGVFHITL